MNYLTKQIVFQEIPDEVSLSYLVTGCPLRCPGCHSSDSWSAQSGWILNPETLLEDLNKNEGFISCVLFMGGEWEPDSLIKLLKIIKSKNIKTALYTGRDEIEQTIMDHLNYLKTGPYLAAKGGLGSQNTNQKLIKLA